MKYMKKKNFTQIFFIFYVLILIAIPINIISTSFPLRSYDSVDKEKPNPSDVFITTLNGKEYLAEYITREKVEEMKKQSELKISSKNYNQIIDGHGTGYAPPTAEDLEKLIGKVAILDVIPDAGFQNYGASADISTEIYFPVVGDQAMQGSCTAWANAYYAYGYMEAKDYGWDASSGNTDYLLSPAWAYNMVSAFDYGSVPIELAQLIIEWGVSTLSTMPYNDFDVDSWGEEPAWREAPYHRPLNYNPIFFVGPTTIDTIKSLLDSGTPVTIGIDAYQYDPGFDDGNYIISSSEYDSSGSLNHAQCFVGYDDSITDDGDIGAFRVVNSWGLGWGDNGYYWLTYDAFSEFADDIYQSILYYTDRIDYNPSLIGTWEFSDAPTRMDDIITLGVGTYETPLGTINPLYDNDIVNSFPEFMALDISDFQTYYNGDPDVFFFLDVGSSTTTGTISSFLIERYIGGSLVEISPESPDVPEDTPGYVYSTFKIFDHELKVSLEVPSNPEIGNSYLINATVTNNGLNAEINVDLYLYLDNGLVNSTSGVSLPVGENKTITHTWIPSVYKTYNFTAYAPPVPDETLTGNNVITKIIPIMDIQLFDGMYIDLNYTEAGTTYPTRFSYSFYSGSLFYETWEIMGSPIMWYVDSQTRIMSGGSVFGDGTHTPAWIFTDVSIGDQILIAADAEGDHLFEVSRELIYDIPGFGLVEIWELEDLTFPPGIAWYEKSTGILLNGTFYYGPSWYTFNFVDTNVQFSYITLDHELKVSLEVPSSPDLGDTYIINATVFNNGNYDESNVDLFLYLDNVLVDSITISTLPIDASETINYIWTPSEYKKYNFTAYAPPVPSETYLINNRITKLISIRKTVFFEDFESGLSKWETITGLWHLTDDTSIWPDPYHSPTHSMWFGNEFTGDYDTGYSEMGDLISYPIDLSSFEDIILEFYHWREGEGFGWDVSFVYISTDGFNWDLLYESDTAYILPWEKVSLDISGYAGNSSVQLKFSFDTFDEAANDYRGWLVDDIEILGTPSLTITTPDSTSSWETGTSQSINWVSTGTISDVKIELYENDGFVMEIVASTPNNGEFSWLIPTTLVDSTQYQIKISDVSNPSIYEISDNFEIFTTPVVIDSITITNPDSLTVWEMGTSQDITWTSTGTISDVKIELFKGGVFEMEIIASTANDGTYNWDIPTDLEDGIDYQIKISDVSNPATYDESPNFAITSVDIPPAIPSYNLFIIIGMICVVSVILIKKRFKLIK